MLWQAINSFIECIFDIYNYICSSLVRLRSGAFLSAYIAVNVIKSNKYVHYFTVEGTSLLKVNL